MIRVAIVEDEKKYAQGLHEFLLRFERERKTEFTVSFFGSGLDFVSDYRSEFDLIFMDIELPHMNGMDCAVRLRKLDKEVALVFVTNMVQYAVRGYEVDALGYMVKPIEYFSFSVLMDKVLAKLAARDTMEIYVKSGDHVKRLYARDICYVEVMDHYIIYHTAEGEFREIGKIKDVEARLSGSTFFRCSNSYLVNMRHVREIAENEVFVGGDKLLISRRRKKDFLSAMNDFFRHGGT